MIFPLDIDNGQFLPLHEMFVGKKAKDILKSVGKKDIEVASFLKSTAAAYINCGKHMQRKLPLHNELLMGMSAMDPTARGHGETAKAMEKLGNKLSGFLSEEELDRLCLEVKKYQVDKKLGPAEVGARIDDWWNSVMESNRYPVLSKMALVCLSVFHGPIVESSFNTMGDVIDIRSTRMKIETYSAIQTVRYGLKSRNQTAVGMFKKEGVHEKVGMSLVKNFHWAARDYKQEKESLRKAKEERVAALREKQDLIESRASEKRKNEQAAKVARLAHERARKRTMHDKLTALVKRRKTVIPKICVQKQFFVVPVGKTSYLLYLTRIISCSSS